MATAGDLSAYHVDLIGRIHAHVSQQLSITTPSETWQRASAKSRISFDICQNGTPAFATRARGGRCAVFPLSKSYRYVESHIWVNWHEEWYCRARNDFDLIGAGWTFFWGVEGRLGSEQQILRAEWDQLTYRGGNAAQPHWHVDRQLLAGYWPARSNNTSESSELDELQPVIRGSELEEIGPAPGLQEIDLSAMHLGMGGWHHRDSFPACWQMQVEDDLSRVAMWAERCLRYATDQFPLLASGEGIV